MKFPQIKGVTIAVIYFFAFYAICGCSSTKQSTTYLDKYDTKPYTGAITVKASEDVAYKTAIVSLEKRGYILTLSDPQTGVANLELSTSTKLPEEEKQIQANDSGPSAGTIILYALAIVLVVGIIILLLSSSDDSKDKDKDKNKDNNTEYRKGRIDSGHPSEPSSHKITPPPHHEETGRHEHHEYRDRDHWHDDMLYWDLFVNPFLVSAPPPPPPGPSYRYVVTVNTTPLSDSTTQIALETTRVDMVGGSITKTEHFENKYLNCSVFDAIEEQLAGK